MKRLVFALVVMLNVSLLHSQFGFDKLHKVKEGFDTAKKVTQAMRPINEEEEYFLGRAVAAQILSRYNLWKSEVMTAYISLIGNFLALHSQRPEIFDGYHFAVLDSAEINAFAAPGGIVFVTRGLIAACRNEDELAAVLAHEVCHVASKDPTQAIQTGRLKTLFSIGANELANAGPQVVGLFKDSALDITTTVINKGYSRKQEKQADLATLELLAGAGYSPHALFDMLEKLQKRQDRKLKIFSAHPPAGERCEYVAIALKRYGKTEIADARSSRFATIVKLAGI